MTPGLSRESSSIETSADPRQAGLSSSSPRSQQLELLPVAELPDRAVRDRADAIVAVARGALDLVLPVATKVRELALVARVGELLRFCRRFGEVQCGEAIGYSRGSGPTYSAPGRMILLSACCSST